MIKYSKLDRVYLETSFVTEFLMNCKMHIINTVLQSCWQKYNNENGEQQKLSCSYKTPKICYLK